MEEVVATSMIQPMSVDVLAGTEDQTVKVSKFMRNAIFV